MKVYITGGTGYVGQKIVKMLLEKGHELTCLVRSGSENKLNDIADQITMQTGNVLEPSSIDLTGQEAIIHLVAIIREIPKEGLTFKDYNYQSAKNMIDAAVNQGVMRFLLMSAAGDFLILKNYFKYKVLAEDDLKKTDLKWSIFRPAVIYDQSWWGKSKGWMEMANPFFKLAACLPGVGDFFMKWKPITKELVAKAFVRVINDESFIGKTIIGRDFYKLNIPMVFLL